MMSDELCDEFVSWTNHVGRMLAFAGVSYSSGGRFVTFDRVVCFDFC